MKKLVLRSETVRMLTEAALDQVVGGSTYPDTSCPNTGPGTCNGCTQYCWAPTDAPGGCSTEYCVTRILE